jgi:uncharacterized membrane protein
MNITAIDVLLIIGYILLILAYVQRITTRQSIAAVIGYTLLLIGKRFEFSYGRDDDMTKRIKRAGYMVLFASPSFEHWHDIFALIGYMYCALAKFDESTAPLAIYYILGAEVTTSHLSKLARSLLGFAMMMGVKSPLQ